MRLGNHRLALPLFCALLAWTRLAAITSAQEVTAAQTRQTSTPPSARAASPSDDSASGDTVTVFPHSQTARYWISGQANIILEWHGDFPAAYSGPNSLRSGAENATSQVYTLYLGYELTPTTDCFLDIESAGGRGLSNSLGLAGITNLDVVRNTTLGQAPYVARLMLRQIVPLTDERMESERDELHLATSLPVRRIEFRIGKFGLADFFDVNTWASDSHLQFLNWTIDNNGAYDYAANTRGYTDGVILEYDDHWFSVRFAEALMPKVANGIHLDANIARARAENLEFQATGSRLFHRSGTVRFLTYLNHANMGNYREAIDEYLAGPRASPPDITRTRRQGRHKYGFGLNFEQSITPDIGVFARLGSSDGRNESFAYTEDDRTLELGLFAPGSAWRRRNDRAGIAFVTNRIVGEHQQYLALGGLGFLLGDGGLTYGAEKIFEAFYTTHIWRGLFASFDIQHIEDPGYNQARGPVTVPGLRFHVDF
jgi:high affinity Mn2+ porin